uniref:Late embryogenesis abundant protein LEA-2 subgroup domain-containing protein n=1 Tax=Nelumbo nucifera TaxID=4432 RepID=A0A822Y3E8_NELNU|nr:TPA_asm: hypothetical protein HUJ06_028415 [Nelumbo nucifera]
MAAKGEPVYYSPIPSPPPELQYHQQPPPQQHYIILPLYCPPCQFRVLRRHLLGVAALLLFAGGLYLIWPSGPEVNVVRLGLGHVQVHTSPRVSIDVSVALTVKARNRDFFSFNYSSIVISIGYRGKQFGFVTSNGGHVRARGSSYVNATLNFDGVEILDDVFLLLKDLAKGSIPLDTVSEVQGQLQFLFFFNFPLKVIARSSFLFDWYVLACECFD